MALGGILPKLRKGMTYPKYFIKEFPDITTCFVYFTIGFVALAVGTKVYDKDTYHQHKFEYTVVREEEADPVVKAKGCYN